MGLITNVFWFHKQDLKAVSYPGLSGLAPASFLLATNGSTCHTVGSGNENRINKAEIVIDLESGMENGNVIRRSGSGVWHYD